MQTHTESCHCKGVPCCNNACAALSHDRQWDCDDRHWDCDDWHWDCGTVMIGTGTDDRHRDCDDRHWD